MTTPSSISFVIAPTTFGQVYHFSITVRSPHDSDIDEMVRNLASRLSAPQAQRWEAQGAFANAHLEFEFAIMGLNNDQEERHTTVITLKIINPSLAGGFMWRKTMRFVSMRLP